MMSQLIFYVSDYGRGNIDKGTRRKSTVKGKVEIAAKARTNLLKESSSSIFSIFS